MPLKRVAAWRAVGPHSRTFSGGEQHNATALENSTAGALAYINQM